MSTWADITSTGKGAYAFALIIEGWPDIFVTDSRLTLAAVKDGRTVLTGLSVEGIRIHERAVIQEGLSEADGMTVRIKGGGGPNDTVMASLSKLPDPVAWLGSSIDNTQTSWTLKGAGATLDVGTRYHLGTETVKTSGGAFTTIARGEWSTLGQTHNIQDDGNTDDSAELQSVPIYATPPTMQGRAVFLYAYGLDDGLGGLGTIVWRGRVSQPPGLSADLITWEITLDSIISLLDQEVGPTDTGTKIRGIYHHNLCAFAFSLWVETTSPTLQQEVFFDPKLTGLHETEEAFVAAVNAKLATTVSTVNAAAANVLVALLYKPPALDINGKPTSNPTLLMTTGSSANIAYITARGGSPIEGWIDYDDAWRDIDGRPVTGAEIQADTSYIIDFSPQFASKKSEEATRLANEVIVSSAFPRSLLGNPGQPWSFCFEPSDTTNSPWTIHLATNMGSQVIGVLIEGTVPDPPFFSVNSSDGDSLTLDERAVGSDDPTSIQGYMGSLNGDTKVIKLHAYGPTGGGTVETFMLGATLGVAAQAHKANDGSTPYLPSRNLGSWVVQGTHDEKLLNRVYMFASTKSLRDVLSEELKLVGHYMHLDSSGIMRIDPLPTAGANEIGTATIDTTKIITPAGGIGRWERWEPNKDGAINVVVLKGNYDPFTDEWMAPEVIRRNRPHIAEHKTRGRGKVEIAPFSYAVTGEYWTLEQATDIAAPLLDFFQRDYAMVTVEVGLDLFDVLVGDTILLTSPRLPAGDGTRSVSNRRAVVLERDWDLDPASNRKGTLTLMVQQSQGGYTPSARVTSQVNDTGDQWTLTCPNTEDENIAWRQSPSVDVVEHFAVGDYVRIVKWDDDADTFVTGVVDAVNTAAETIQVTFDATWTPGADDWDLIFDEDTDTATSRQRAYVYTADTGLELRNGDKARVFD